MLGCLNWRFRHLAGLTAVVAAAVAAPPAAAQVADPQVLNIGSSSYSTTTLQFNVKNVAGAAGAGYDVRQYGSVGGGLLEFSSLTQGTSLVIRTAAVGSSTPGAATNFDRTQPFSLTLFRPVVAGSTPENFVQFNDAGVFNYPGFGVYSTLAASNARLNQAVSINTSQFFDNVTGAPISAAVGTFSVAFDPASFNAANGYQAINLNYTPVPVPEPALVGAVGTVGLLALRVVRRRVAG